VARRGPAWHPDKVEWFSADITSSDLSPVLVGADAVVHQCTRKRLKELAAAG
jgi:hypothetical protein